MRAFRLVSICVWLLGCGAGDFKPGSSERDSGAADATPDAAMQPGHDASVDHESHDAGGKQQDAGHAGEPAADGDEQD